MPTRRRLVAAAAFGTLAVAALAGCRSAPSVAAYVGDQTYTNKQVDAVYEDVRTKLAAAVNAQAPGQATPAPAQAQSPTRQDVLTALVGRDVAKAAAEAKGLKPVPITADDVAQILQVPPGTEFAKIYAEYQSYIEALVQGATATTPSDEDLHEVLDRLVKGGLQAPGTTFEEFKANVGAANLRVVAQAGQVRAELAEQARKTNVVVNPRYAPVGLTVLAVPDQQGRPYPLLVAPLGAESGSPAVVDLS